MEANVSISVSAGRAICEEAGWPPRVGNFCGVMAMVLLLLAGTWVIYWHLTTLEFGLRAL